MFVHANPVEPELVAEFEFVKVAVVKRVALLRIEMAVRQNNPCAAILVLDAGSRSA